MSFGVNHDQSVFYFKLLGYWNEHVTGIHKTLLEASDVSSEFEEINSIYENNGFLLFGLSPEITAALSGYFHPSNKIKFGRTEVSSDYLIGTAKEDDEVSLNQNITFFGEPDISATSNLKYLLATMRPRIEAAIGGAFAIINVRAWTLNGVSKNIGEYHRDSLPRFVRKIMIYPNPPNSKNGSFQLVGRDKKVHTLKSDVPIAILMESRELRHRAVAPAEISSRPAIEITLVPSLRTNINTEFNGQNVISNFLRSLDFQDLKSFYLDQRLRIQKDVLKVSSKSPSLAQEIKIVPTSLNVNIGGGRKFNYPGWVNFDAASPKLPTRIDFTSKTIFPYLSKTAEVIYSSHCFEHLSDDVVSQMISESHRMLTTEGTLIIKLPDFDRVLEEWRSNNMTGILNPKFWGLSSLFEMWKANGLSDSINYVTAMILCGFWNSQYGDTFKGDRNSNVDGAYHGPPRVEEEKIAAILGSSDSPHFVASVLRAEVLKTEYSPRFNHQNAWSAEEFINIVGLHGYKSLQFNDVASEFPSVPTINEMKQISKYYVFKKI